jgi:anti-anti-sigma regulatory factor
MIVESVDDIIKLSGHLTSNQWETIKTAANLLLRQHPEGVVVDCGGLEEVTPEGAQTFLDMLLHIESQNARIIVANVPPHVQEAIRHVPEVRSRLAIAKSVEEARRSLTVQQSFAAEGIAASKTLKPKSHLIVALSGGRSDSYALAVAAALAEMRRLTVMVLYPITIHRSQPLSVPLPEEEEAGQTVLANAEEFFASHRIACETFMKRGRALYAIIEEISEQQEEKLVVVALPDADTRSKEPASTAGHLLADVRSELILVRHPFDEAAPPPPSR